MSKKVKIFRGMIEEKKLSVSFIYRDNIKISLQGELPSCRCI